MPDVDRLAGYQRNNEARPDDRAKNSDRGKKTSHPSRPRICIAVTISARLYAVGFFYSFDEPEVIPTVNKVDAPISSGPEDYAVGKPEIVL
jgi:hypothetical protein